MSLSAPTAASHALVFGNSNLIEKAACPPLACIRTLSPPSTISAVQSNACSSHVQAMTVWLNPNRNGVAFASARERVVVAKISIVPPKSAQLSLSAFAKGRSWDSAAARLTVSHRLEYEDRCRQNAMSCTLKIKGLNAGYTLLDRIQSVIKVELLDVEVTRIAVAAVDLNCEVVRNAPPLRGPGHSDRGKKGKQLGRFRIHRFLAHKQRKNCGTDPALTSRYPAEPQPPLPF